MNRSGYLAACLIVILGTAASVLGWTGGSQGEASSVQRQPGILFSSLLNNVTLLARRGYFRLDNQMLSVFVPDKGAGTAVLSTREGKQICVWDWEEGTFGVDPPFKIFVFRSGANPAGSDADCGNLTLKTAGEYVLDLNLGSEKMFTFPFSVSVLEPDDPFDGNPLYLIDGAWSRWGYFFYANGEADNSLSWKLWLRERGFRAKDHVLDLRLTRDKDGKLVAQNRENMTYSLRPDWVRYDFSLIKPPKDPGGGGMIKAQEILAVDGGYTLTMKIDGDVYGVWKFEVAGGKFKPKGRTERGVADPLTFVEGGRDAFWYEKEG